MGSRVRGSVQEDEAALGEEGWEAGYKGRGCTEPPAWLAGAGCLGKPWPALGKQKPPGAVGQSLWWLLRWVVTFAAWGRDMPQRPKHILILPSFKCCWDITLIIHVLCYSLDWPCVFSVPLEFWRLAGKVMPANPPVEIYTRPLFSFDNGFKKIPEWTKLYWQNYFFPPFYNYIFITFFFFLFLDDITAGEERIIPYMAQQYQQKSCSKEKISPYALF